MASEPEGGKARPLFEHLSDDLALLRAAQVDTAQGSSLGTRQSNSDALSGCIKLHR